MARIIDADKFCDIIDDTCLRLAKKLGYKSYKELSENMKWYWDGISCAVGVVLDMPTVDAVEVTRCKDCEHWTNDDCPFAWGKVEDAFCSYAERRTDE